MKNFSSGKSISLFLALLLAVIPRLMADEIPADNSHWARWKFLIGSWQAVGEEYPPLSTERFDRCSFAFETDSNRIIWIRQEKYMIYDGPSVTRDTRTTIHPTASGNFEGTLEGRESAGPFSGVDGAKRPGYNKDISDHFTIFFSASGDSLYFLRGPQMDGNQDRQTFVKAESNHFWLRRDLINPLQNSSPQNVRLTRFERSNVSAR